MELLQRFHRTYEFLFKDLSDPRSTDWFPVSNPLYAVAMVYLYVKFANEWGPRFMENRKPFQMKQIIVIYNLSQIIINVYLILMGVSYIMGYGYNLLCEPMQYEYTQRELEIVTLTRYFFLLKAYDLLDTVFHVLRKKTGHTSFLHLYHHIGMFLVTWNSVKYVPGGHGFFLAFQNCIVHAFMYSYYLLTAISPQYQKNIWWKKYLTQLQMVQFLLNTIQMSLPLLWTDCAYPKVGLWIMVPQNLFMFLLFADFYRKTYVNNKTNHIS